MRALIMRGGEGRGMREPQETMQGSSDVHNMRQTGKALHHGVMLYEGQFWFAKKMKIA